MSLKKFGKNDVLVNTMRTYPKSEFLIYDSKVYYNNVPNQSGSKNQYVRNVPPGYISLYEYNIDRQYVDTGRDISTSGLGFDASDGVHEASASVADTGRIYAWTNKGSDYYNLTTVSQEAYDLTPTDDILTATYPFSASITRELMGIDGGSITAGSTAEIDVTEEISGEDVPVGTDITPYYRHYFALKNTLDHNGIQSVNYRIIGTSSATSNWNKADQIINMISIPKIFYGSRIKPGSLSLKWYVTGTLAGELQDARQNGELRQVANSSEHSTAYDDECAGVVLYKEGFILLTGSWSLDPAAMALSSSGGEDPSWIYFGAGAADGPSADPPHGGSNSRDTGVDVSTNASFKLSFQGETETQVMTMFSRAGRGAVNYSNNATYLKYGQNPLLSTSSQFYEENPNRTIYNSVSSSYPDYEAPFKKQVYVSRVAIYDDKKNLLGIATLANPVLKREDQDITFKLRLDL